MAGPAMLVTVESSISIAEPVRITASAGHRHR